MKLQLGEKIRGESSKGEGGTELNQNRCIKKELEARKGGAHSQGNS